MSEPSPDRFLDITPFDISPKEETILQSVQYYERYGLEIIEAIKAVSKGKIELWI